MSKIYEPNNFCYPLNEDMITVYDAKKAYDTEPDNLLKRYELKKAVYNVSLTLKSLVSVGALREEVRAEVEDYFWGMLL